MAATPSTLTCVPAPTTSVLVNMKFSESPDLSEAGESALSAMCAFNRENTVGYLREAVHRLQQGEAKALDTIDTLLGALEVGGEVGWCCTQQPFADMLLYVQQVPIST